MNITLYVRPGEQTADRKIFTKNEGFSVSASNSSNPVLSEDEGCPVKTDLSRIFHRIQAAVDFAGQLAEENPETAATIDIAPGIYRERLEIKVPGLILTGEPGKEKETVIRADTGAYEILEDGIKRGTFRTQTVLVTADGVCMRNLTIENGAGPGHQAGQAIALHAYADRLSFEHLRLIGQQDTLFAGPLPEKEVEPGGFRGPTEFFPRSLCRMHFRECYIEGNIDFIFGGAAAWFEQCEIFCRDSRQGTDPIAYVTAPSTPAGQDCGFVMDRCLLTSDCPPESCFLGRPWREDAQAVYMDCRFGPHIKKELWNDWGKPEVRTRSCFAVFNCVFETGNGLKSESGPKSGTGLESESGPKSETTGKSEPGPKPEADCIAPFSRILTANEARQIRDTVRNLFLKDPVF